MAIITVNVPDNKLHFYKQVLSEFKDISIQENTIDDVFTEDVLEMLHKRSSAPIEECLTLDEVKERIKNKYTQYGI